MSGEVTFTAKEADWVAANRLWHARSARQKWLLWLGTAATLLALADVAFRLREGDTPLTALDDALVMIVVATVTLVTRWATPAMLPRQVRRMMHQHPTMGEPIHCSWSEQGIFFAGGNGTANLPWMRLHRWLDDDATFVFLQTDRLMYAVPRRFLSTAQDADLLATAHASGLARR